MSVVRAFLFTLTIGCAAIILMGCFNPVFAGSIDSETINYGSACSGTISAADWDTIAECSSSVWKRGPFFFGATSDTCDSNHAGMVRYNSSTTNIEYCNATAWTNLAATGAGADYAGATSAASLSVSTLQACFVTTAGAAYCWGEETASAYLGNGSTYAGYFTQPQPVSGGYSFSKVVTNEYGGCGLTTGSAIYCWGNNTAGQIGNNSTTLATTPTIVSGGYSWTDVSGGGIDSAAATSTYGVTAANGLFFNCGITSGAAYCWGDNTVGQLGTGNTTASKTPVAVSGGLTFASLAVLSGGYSEHMCGVTTTGVAYCWGGNNDGQLGNGTTANSSSPVVVSGGHTFSNIAMTTEDTCGVTTTGAAYCWGLGTSGVLGNGSGSNQTSPVLVNGGYTFSKVRLGDVQSWGLTTAGSLYFWGSNAGGVLGTTSAFTSPTLYTPPSSISGTKWVDMGASHNCQFIGVRDNGTVYAPATGCSGGMSGTPQFGSLILMQ